VPKKCACTMSTYHTRGLQGRSRHFCPFAVDEAGATQRHAVGLVEHDPVAPAVRRPRVGVARRHDRPVDLRFIQDSIRWDDRNIHRAVRAKKHCIFSSNRRCITWSVTLPWHGPLNTVARTRNVRPAARRPARRAAPARGAPRGLDRAGVVRHAVPGGAEALDEVVHDDRTRPRRRRARGSAPRLFCALVVVGHEESCLVRLVAWRRPPLPPWAPSQRKVDATASARSREVAILAAASIGPTDQPS
jgi:hypothetical protein